MVVTVNQQHSVSGGYSKQGNESDDGRDADFTRSEQQCKDSSDQRQRQVQQDNSALHRTSEFHVQQQEYDHYAHERSQKKGAARRLFTLELSAILDMVSLRQHDLCIYPVLDVIHHSSEVPAGSVGGNDYLPFDIFPVDGVRA